MAKMNLTVDNGLDEVKLESSEKLKSKKNKKEEKQVKEKKTKKNKSGEKNFLKEVGKEMNLVTWPSKKNVVKYSVAAILMIVLLAVFFIGIAALFDLLYGLVQGWIG